MVVTQRESTSGIGEVLVTFTLSTKGRFIFLCFAKGTSGIDLSQSWWGDWQVTENKIKCAHIFNLLYVRNVLLVCKSLEKAESSCDCYFVSVEHNTSRVPGADGGKAGGFEKQWNLNQDSSRGYWRRKRPTDGLMWKSENTHKSPAYDSPREEGSARMQAVVQRNGPVCWVEGCKACWGKSEYLSLPTLLELLGWDTRISKMWLEKRRSFRARLTKKDNDID